MNLLFCLRLILSLSFIVICLSARAGELTIKIAYVEKAIPPVATVSKLMLSPDDEGVQGARLGVGDNATTGKFLKHNYELGEFFIADEDDWVTRVHEIAKEYPYIVINAPSAELLAIADADWAQNILLFNVSAADDELRNEQCRKNLFHTASSHSMRADALMQVISQKRWAPVLLIEGASSADAKFANALRRAAFKFRIDISDEVLFKYNADIRRGASKEVPLLTQSEYNSVIIADALHDFGQYFMYNTWLPRPVAGDHGMMVVGFHKAMEQWGALQLHSRFEAMANRYIVSKDYYAWAAVRSIGEAVTRTGENKVSTTREYLLSENFELGGFKGQPLSYRNWNGQLRQPMGVVHSFATVALPPLDVFLHEHSVLDTLGFDRPETTCTQFN